MSTIQPESHLARVARERKEARADQGKSPATMPRTKLKRARKIVEVEAKPLLTPLTDLKFHPLLKRVAMLPALIERETKLGNAQGKSRAAHKAAAEEMAHDFAALVESISRHGVRERIKVLMTPKGLVIVDGRHRYEAACQVAKMSYAEPQREAIARKLATDGIPCEIVTENDVVPIIMDAVTRRHMSKGARAYLAVLMEPEVAADAKDRQKQGAPSAFSAEGLAKRAGVSARLVEDAIALFRIFEKRGDARKKFEDAIWVGAGLAKLRNGIEGFLATGKEPDEEPETPAQAKARIAQERVETALKQWVGVTTSLKHWETMPALGREEVVAASARTIREAPGEFREALTKALLADSQA